jgi:carbamoyltransferase
LGARSILADPRDPEMQSKLNLKVKFRESFRPFAPAILRESLAEWFELDTDSPYMLFVADVARAHRIDSPQANVHLQWLDRLRIPRSDIPAATHVDGSARIQTVYKQTNPRFHMLISAFAKRTGCPVLVNTSFNVRGEPIVCTPDDAFRCFMGTGLDSLAIGNCFLRKADQDDSLGRQYEQKFEAD